MLGILIFTSDLKKISKKNFTSEVKMMVVSKMKIYSIKIVTFLQINDACIFNQFYSAFVNFSYYIYSKF